jgi:hypothetical protein
LCTSMMLFISVLLFFSVGEVPLLADVVVHLLRLSLELFFVLGLR